MLQVIFNCFGRVEWWCLSLCRVLREFVLGLHGFVVLKLGFILDFGEPLNRA